MTTLAGRGAPSSGLGASGDFYIDIQNLGAYGAKNEEGWGSPTLFQGSPGATGATGPAGSTTAGNTLLNGSGVPGSGLGNNGDFYLDVSAWPYRIYGPKTLGAWGSGVSVATPALTSAAIISTGVAASQLNGDVAGTSAAETTRAEAAEATITSSVTTEATARAAGDALAVQKSANGSDFADAGTTRLNLKVSALTAVAAVATTNVASLTTLATVDGYTLAAGDQVLLTAQSTASQNGPWVAASGAWTRPTGFASAAVVGGRTCQVLNGTANGGTFWVLVAPTAGVTVDSSNQVWTNFFDARYQIAANGTGAVVLATATHATALNETTICTSGTFTNTLPTPVANGECKVLNIGSGSITVHTPSGTLYSLTSTTGDQTLAQGVGHTYRSSVGTNWYAVS